MLCKKHGTQLPSLQIAPLKWSQNQHELFFYLVHFHQLLKRCQKKKNPASQSFIFSREMIS